MTHVENLGSEFRIILSPDKDGYIGRECPNRDCLKYFKIVSGTGLDNVMKCCCPYCGCIAEQSSFHTPEQIEYAQSVVVQKVNQEFLKDLKELEFNIKPKGFGIGISLKVEQTSKVRVKYYREKELETQIVCPACSLKYAIYGLFAFCPDCRQHNSLQILDKNLIIINKMLELAATEESELAIKMIENALEDCVSAFDGFGREICRVHARLSFNPEKARRISFQNLEIAKDNVLKFFDFDMTHGLIDKDWETASLAFQKRHLITHRMGVVDEQYLAKTQDKEAVIGRKISVSSEEVRKLLSIIEKLSRCLSEGFKSLN